MRLLIFTQKVDQNDDHFTFFLDWIREFANNCESVIVVTLWKGSYVLPPNVKVLSLGKETHSSRLEYLFNFYKYIYKFRNSYDHVFVHMNPEYVVLGGLFWRLWGKKIALWYTHKHVDLKLSLATALTDVVFSASEKSFRISTPKLQVVGHGVNTEMFKCREELVGNKKDGEIRIVTVSRIAKIKSLETFIKAVAILSKKIQIPISAHIISRIPQENDPYFLSLKVLIDDLKMQNIIKFSGAIPGKDLPQQYCLSDFSVNLTPSGGIDKAVLESMSCGVPCLFSNDALIPDVDIYKEILMFEFGNADDLAQKMENIINNKPSGLGLYLREKVITRHDYKKFITNIISKMK